MRCFTSMAVALFSITCMAAPNDALNVCFVRTDMVPAAAGAGSEPRPVQSHLGLRPKGTQLFELDISVAGENDAVCMVNGVAKLRGEPGRELLALVVRNDLSFKNMGTGTVCQVFVQLTPTAVELATTQSSCRAQALCGGQVQLHGQRFERSTQLQGAAKGPCFAARAQ
jgi:hypothetical protein